MLRKEAARLDIVKVTCRWHAGNLQSHPTAVTRLEGDNLRKYLAAADDSIKPGGTYSHSSVLHNDRCQLSCGRRPYSILFPKCKVDDLPGR